MMEKCWMCGRTKEEVKKDYPSIDELSDAIVVRMSDPLKDTEVCLICWWIIYQIGSNSTADAFDDFIKIEIKPCNPFKLKRVKE